MRLFRQDSITGRAAKTLLQAFLGFFPGLAIAIWAIPEVQYVVVNYLREYLIQLAVIFGINVGAISFLYNLFFRRGELADY